jgi:hypothetical protein
VGCQQTTGARQKKAAEHWRSRREVHELVAGKSHRNLNWSEEIDGTIF